MVAQLCEHTKKQNCALSVGELYGIYLNKAVKK